MSEHSTSMTGRKNAITMHDRVIHFVHWIVWSKMAKVCSMATGKSGWEKVSVYLGNLGGNDCGGGTSANSVVMITFLISRLS